VLEVEWLNIHGYEEIFSFFLKIDLVTF